MYLSESEATKEEKWKNLFFLYKSIDFDPKITIANISASNHANCPICMILDSLDSSHLVLVIPSDKMVIYIKQIKYFHFQGHTKVNSRSKENVV